MAGIKKDDTEEKILESAKEIFLAKGFDGSRMQEIANHAGINKSLLHYYYRTKEKLFKSVFKFVIKHFMPRIEGVLSDPNLSVLEKISAFVDSYLDIIYKNRFLPMFVLYELQKNPKGLGEIISNSIPIDVRSFEEEINNAVKLKIIKPISPKHLITNIVGLCIFPIVAKPILTGVLFDNNPDDFEQFLQERKQTVKEFIFNSIRNDKN